MTQTVDGTRSLKISELKRHKLLQRGKIRPWLWRTEEAKLTREVTLDYGRVRGHRMRTI